MRRGNRGFTLTELLVVMGMMGILMATAATGLSQAKNRARTTKAHSEVRALIGAWLAYEASYDDWPEQLPAEETDATDALLEKLLGKGPDGLVFLNAKIVNGAFRDPWGKPYKLRFIERQQKESVEQFSAAISFPNRNRPPQ